MPVGHQSAVSQQTHTHTNPPPPPSTSSLGLPFQSRAFQNSLSTLWSWIPSLFHFFHPVFICCMAVLCNTPYRTRPPSRSHNHTNVFGMTVADPRQQDFLLKQAAFGRGYSAGRFRPSPVRHILRSESTSVGCPTSSRLVAHKYERCGGGAGHQPAACVKERAITSADVLQPPGFMDCQLSGPHPAGYQLDLLLM